MSRRDSALAVMVAVIWGLSFVVAKWALIAMPPLMFASLRFWVVAGLALFLPKPQSSWRVLVAYGFVSGTVQFGGIFLALGLGLPAGLTAIVMQSQLVFTLLFAFGLRLEAPKPRHAWMIGLAGTGLVVIGTAHGHHVPLAGFVAAVCGAIGWASANVLARRLKHQRVDQLSFVARASIVPAITLFALSIAIEGPRSVGMLVDHFGTREAFALAFQSGLSLIVAGLTWNALLRRNLASAVAPFSLLVPFVGLIGGHLEFGEAVSAREALGSGLLLAGLAINFIAFPRTARVAAAPVPR